MLFEINGISCTLFQTDSEAFFMQSASDRGNFFVIEYLTQTVHCIYVVVCSFRRYIYQICPGNLKSFISLIKFFSARVCVGVFSPNLLNPACNVLKMFSYTCL